MKAEDLSPHEQRRLLDRFQNHQLFCKQSLQLRNLDGITGPLDLSPGQLKLDQVIEAEEKLGKPVRLIVLKPRRTYFTVGVCAEFFRRTPFIPGQKSLVIADRYNPAAIEAFDYFLQFQRGYRPFDGLIKLPGLVKDTEQELEWENGSGVKVLSAEKGDVGRGGGFRYVLCDEVAFWRAPELTLTGVLNTVPDRPGTIIVVQSTANGQGGEFWELWNKATDPSRNAGWKALFFSWLEHPHYQLPVEDVTAFMKTLDREEQLLHKFHRASPQQLAWRRWIIDTKCRGKVDLFHQEYPTTPEEAFLTSGRPALSLAELERMPTWKEPAVGELRIEESFPRNRLIFIPHEHGALLMGARPDPEREYVIGADPSHGVDISAEKRGHDPDWSVAVVLDRKTGEQVAQLRDRLRPIPFAEYLALLGKYYNFAWLVPESNDTGFIDGILRTGYPLERIYREQRDPTDLRTASTEQIGYRVTNVSRPQLVAALDDAIRDMSVIIRSPIAKQECRTFVYNPSGKPEHQVGCHDDCVFALALAVMGLRTAPRYGSGGTRERARVGVKRYGEAKVQTVERW